MTVTSCGPGSSYVLQKTEIPFHLEPSVVVDLLNDLYAMDFFSLKDSYVERHTVRARADGTVEHFALTVSDDPHQIVTVHIGAYMKQIEKNSMYGPKDLVALGEKIDAITNSSQWTKAPR